MKILLIRFSSIGDIVLTTPVARCLKQQLGAEVHFLTKQAFAGLITPNPNVDKVFSLEPKLSQVIPALKAEQYDYVIDLHNNLRSLRVKLALGRPAASFNKLNPEKWLLVNMGLNFIPETHIVQRYLATAKHLGVEYDGQGLDHHIPASESVALEQLSTKLQNGQFIAFVIGATHATKRMPPEKMLEICQNLQLPVAVLGGKSEMAAGQYLAENGGGNTVNLCGQLSIHQSASVIDQSAAVLTHDTGLMHIAAALKKPIVSVWGSTVPQFGMFPLYPEGTQLNTSMEVEGLKCRPCSKIGYNKCPKGHFRCMMDIDVQEISRVLSAIQSQ